MKEKHKRRRSHAVDNFAAFSLSSPVKPTNRRSSPNLQAAATTDIYGNAAPVDQTEMARKRTAPVVRISEMTTDSDSIEYTRDAEELSEVEVGYDEMEEEDECANQVVCQLPIFEDFFEVGPVLLSDETSDDTTDTIESFHRSPIETEEDFFNKLGDVPDIRDMSTISMDGTKVRFSHTDSMGSAYGKFVDPLTGKAVHIERERDLFVSFEIEEEEEVVEGSEESEMAQNIPAYDEFSFDDYDSNFPMPAEKFKGISELTAEDEDFIIFVVPHDSLKPDDEEMPQPGLTLAQDAALETEKFLTDLLNYVTRVCEYEQSAQIIRKKLNKHALFCEIKKNVMDMDVERKVNAFLNRKCVDYFRRKGNMRYLQDEKPDKVMQDLAVYREKIEMLKTLLDKECAMFRKTHKLITDLKYDVDEVDEEKRLEIVALENLIRKTIKCHLNPAFEKFVNTQLRHMATLRDEISSTRSVIIRRQHTLANLRVRQHNLENIGDGLRLQDYESLQRDMGALEKKIEDRNRELDKMHFRYHNSLHSMAHIELKNETTVGSITEKVRNLQELEEQELLTRTRLFYLNVNHKRTRRHLKDLSLQSGLLDKPALLHDYDETFERVKAQREKVMEMRKKYQELDTKLKQLQAPENKPTESPHKATKNLKHKNQSLSVCATEGNFCFKFLD